jgi:hypothetical protein
MNPKRLTAGRRAKEQEAEALTRASVLGSSGASVRSSVAGEAGATPSPRSLPQSPSRLRPALDT